MTITLSKVVWLADSETLVRGWIRITAIGSAEKIGDEWRASLYIGLAESTRVPTLRQAQEWVEQRTRDRIASWIEEEEADRGAS